VEADTAVLAGLVTQMSRHRDQSSDDDRRISIAELSRQVGLPVSKVRSDVAQIGRASRLNLY
jgi:hypothetical protein